MGPDIHYDRSLIVPLSRHFHSQIPKGMVHRRTNKVFTSISDKKSVGVKSGNYMKSEVFINREKFGMRHK